MGLIDVGLLHGYVTVTHMGNNDVRILHGYDTVTQLGHIDVEILHGYDTVTHMGHIDVAIFHGYDTVLLYVGASLEQLIDYGNNGLRIKLSLCTRNEIWFKTKLPPIK